MKEKKEMCKLLNKAINMQFGLRLIAKNLEDYLNDNPCLKSILIREAKTEIVGGITILKRNAYTLETLQNNMCQFVEDLSKALGSMRDILTDHEN